VLAPLIEWRESRAATRTSTAAGIIVSFVSSLGSGRSLHFDLSSSWRRVGFVLLAPLLGVTLSAQLSVVCLSDLAWLTPHTASLRRAGLSATDSNRFDCVRPANVPDTFSVQRTGLAAVRVVGKKNRTMGASRIAKRLPNNRTLAATEKRNRAPLR